MDANISEQLRKLYLFDSLNRTMCGGDIRYVPLLGHRRSQEFVLGGLTSEAPISRCRWRLGVKSMGRATCPPPQPTTGSGGAS